MRRFGYARDPICLVACGLYALNRWIVAPRVGAGFLRENFNDVLLIPAALPLILWLQRRLGLRHHDAFPDWKEIALHTAVWTVAAEVIAPRVFAHATADARDVLAYVVGATLAGVGWHRAARRRTDAASR